MTYHMWSGYAILALLLFRVVWGFAGGRTSRFSAFVRPPSVVLAYAKGLFTPHSPRYLGHNPLGGWSIVAMLAALLVQAGTGLFANDDIFTEGPLYDWVTKSTSDWLTRIHEFNQWVIVALVTLHLLAVLFYLVYKRENLIWPMVTGRKRWEAGADQPEIGSPFRAAVIAALAAGVVYLLVR
jgi:cytochrome b